MRWRGAARAGLGILGGGLRVVVNFAVTVMVIGGLFRLLLWLISKIDPAYGLAALFTGLAVICIGFPMLLVGLLVLFDKRAEKKTNAASS